MALLDKASMGGMIGDSLGAPVESGEVADEDAETPQFCKRYKTLWPK